MKLLIVGFGSIGKRHLRNAKVVCSDCNIAVWRQQVKETNLGEYAPLVDTVVFDAATALQWGPDAVIIANPAACHIPTAGVFAAQRIPLLLEKPISHTMEGIETLLQQYRAHAVPCMVGYNFRFYRPLQRLLAVIHDGSIGRVISLRAAIGQYLPDWRPGTDFRVGASARPELGGGAVLELSHEIDYLRWLGGEMATVMAHVGQVSDLNLSVEDSADILCRFVSGAMGNIHVDMVDRAHTRWCRVVGTAGTLELDFCRHELRSYVATERVWRVLHPADTYDSNTMYIEELRHFFDCVRHRSQPCVTGEDGRQVLRIALAIKEAGERGGVVAV